MFAGPSHSVDTIIIIHKFIEKFTIISFQKKKKKFTIIEIYYYFKYYQPIIIHIIKIFLHFNELFGT